MNDSDVVILEKGDPLPTKHGQRFRYRDGKIYEMFLLEIWPDRVEDIWLSPYSG